MLSSRARTLLALILLSAVSASAGQSAQATHKDDIMTGGLLNGVGWRGLDAVQRSMYLRGIIDMSTFLSWAAGKPSDVVQMHWDCKCNLFDMASGVEAIYARDASYRRVPVQLVLTAFLSKAVGKINEVQLAEVMSKNIDISGALADAEASSR